MKKELCRPHLEAVILDVLRDQPGCEGATAIAIEASDDGANWTVKAVDAGSSGHNECITALRYIVSDLQKVYVMTDP